MDAPTEDPAADTGRTAVYRLYDSMGQLLYIGMSCNPKRRWEVHASTKTWWPQVAARTVEWFDSRAEAAKAEKQAIRSEKPQVNFAHAQADIPDPANGDRTLHPYMRIAALLRADILSGAIPAGIALPSEHQLAARFAVTRPTVRRALAVLRAEGLTVTFQGKGAFARDAADRSIPVPAGRPAEIAAMLRKALSPADLAIVAALLSNPDAPPRTPIERYAEAVDEAIRRDPERAARLRKLEEAVGRAETKEEARAAAAKIGPLLDEVFEELAPDWPQVRHGGKPAEGAGECDE